MLFIGYFSGNMAIGTFGALGAFAFLYYLPLPTKHLARRVAKVGGCITLGFFIGAMSHFIPWSVPIALSLISLVSFLVFRIIEAPKPGAFFVIMVSAMGSGTSLDFKGILEATGYVGLGALAAVLVATTVGIIHRKTSGITQPFVDIPFRDRLKHALKYDSRMLLTSIHHAGIIFFASYLGQSLGLGNSYWVTISSAAVLQGDELVVIFHRNIQRITGGMIGLLIGMFFFSLDLSALSIIIIITVLNIFVEYCMVRNYGLANFFTNPLSLLLASLSQGAFNTELIGYRFTGLVLGSIVAFIGAAIISYSIMLSEGKISLPGKDPFTK